MTLFFNLLRIFKTNLHWTELFLKFHFFNKKTTMSKQGFTIKELC